MRSLALLSFFAVAGALPGQDDMVMMQKAVASAASSKSEMLFSVLDEIEKTNFSEAQKKILDGAFLQLKNTDRDELAMMVEKATPSIKMMLTGVVSMLQGILMQMMMDRNTLQATIDEMLDLPSSCNETFVVQEANSRAVWEANKLTHQYCREAEALLHDAEGEKCDELEGYLNGLVAPNCIPPEARRDLGQEWDNYLTTVLAYFTNTELDFLEKSDACENAREAWNNKTAECDQAQSTFEQTFCSWAELLVLMCEGLNTCYAEKITHYADNRGEWETLGDKRAAEARILLHVICLLNNIAVYDITDETQCPYTDINDPTIQAYNNVFHEIPSTPPCTDPNVPTVPGEQGFFTEHYTLIDNAPYDDESAIDCSDAVRNN